MLNILLSKASKKFLKKCEKNLRERILINIKKLKGEPFPSNARRIIGKKDKIFRIRVGDYRILYQVFYDENKIFIIEIDKRSRIYLVV